MEDPCNIDLPLLQQADFRRDPEDADMRHLLDKMDGSFLHCEKRLPDASPDDIIQCNPEHIERVGLYLRTEAAAYVPVIDQTEDIIDGFQTPLGMELLATVDWLVSREDCERTIVRRFRMAWASKCADPTGLRFVGA